MTAPTNLSFESAGATPGSAASWTTAETSAFWAAGQFNTGGAFALGRESFEHGWANDAYLTAMVDGVDTAEGAFSTVTTAESFEASWGADPYLFAHDALTAGAFSPDSHESFEAGWSNVPYLLALVDGVDTTAAIFDASIFHPHAFEQFDGWTDYLTTMVDGVDQVAGNFVSGGFSLSFEDFESGQHQVPFTVDTVASRLVSPAHSLVNTTVQFVLVGDNGGLLPQPLQPDVPYFVVNALTNSLQLSLSSGGAAITFTTPGGGDLRLEWNPAQYWPVSLAAF